MSASDDLAALQDMLGTGMELDDTSLGAFVHTKHNALHEVFERLHLKPTDVLLDIGCGDGRAAVLAAEHFPCGAVGGIDVDWSVIESFERRWNAALDRIITKRTADAQTSSSSGTDHNEVKEQQQQPPLCVCIAGDALQWAAQDRLFFTPEEQASLPRSKAYVQNALQTSSSNCMLYLPRPTHIYLYILQHMLYKLVPLMHRIRREIPGVVIVSAFPFRVRPSVLRRRRQEAGTTAEEAAVVPAEDEDGSEEYLDVEPSEIYLDSQGKLEFRIYK